jgi:flagellar basal-body rod protein FlgB
MINPLFDKNKNNLVLQAALDGYTARHRAIVNNIANVDTPGYQRIEVSFEDSLRKASKSLMSSVSEETGENEGMSSVERMSISPRVSIDTSQPLRADGSNVSIDREMAELSKNSGKISALTEILIRNYRDLKTAIKGN